MTTSTTRRALVLSLLSVWAWRAHAQTPPAVLPAARSLPEELSAALRHGQPLVVMVSLEGCIFCKIANHEVNARIVFENDRVVAFHDLFPAAPAHLLVIPKQHYGTLNDVPASEAALLGELMTTATQLARENGFDEDGYRVVMNCNGNGGQSVYHIHLHVLAGRKLSWPPG